MRPRRDGSRERRRLRRRRSGHAPQITGLNVQPQSIPQSDTGMTDETLDVSITIDGFEGSIQDADIFVQLDGEERQAAKDDFQMSQA